MQANVSRNEILIKRDQLGIFFGIIPWKVLGEHSLVQNKAGKAGGHLKIDLSHALPSHGEIRAFPHNPLNVNLNFKSHINIDNPSQCHLMRIASKKVLWKHSLRLF